MRRLVVWVALDDAQEVLGDSRRLRERAQDVHVDGPRLVPKRLRPVLVPVLLEKVAGVGRLGRAPAAAAPPPASPIAGREAPLAPSRRTTRRRARRRRATSRIAPSTATTKWSWASDRAGSRTDRSVLSATERRLPVVLGSSFGPQRLDQLFARHGVSAARGEDLQQVARLLRLPLLRGHGLPWRRTRKPPSVWSVSGVGASRRRPSGSRPHGPPVSRKPSSRSSRSMRSASSLASRDAGECELDSLGRDLFAEVAPERKRLLESRRIGRAGAEREQLQRLGDRRAGRRGVGPLPPPSRRARPRVRARLGVARSIPR